MYASDGTYCVADDPVCRWGPGGRGRPRWSTAPPASFPFASSSSSATRTSLPFFLLRGPGGRRIIGGAGPARPYGQADRPRSPSVSPRHQSPLSPVTTILPAFSRCETATFAVGLLPTPSVPLSLSFENRAPLTIPVPERQTQWDGGSNY